MFSTKSDKVTSAVKGFTLVELLIVIAIIGILTAIAVPTFLGEREKAKVRTLQYGARSASSDIQAYLDAYVSGEPYLIVTDTSGNEGCFESSTASVVNEKSCNSLFKTASAGTYPVYPAGITTVITHFVSHQSYKGDKSVYTGNPLFVTGPTVNSGEILITPASSRAVNILAYTTNTTSPAFSQMVTTR
ncbi:type II secretion system protein [Candidatus Magnetomonas plexicatena]|uniref:type II secretion system protein n=1 Tax=Candidatus Magnetomonas plexicatena TaxID=2552947 RepID=UPI0040329EFA